MKKFLFPILIALVLGSGSALAQSASLSGFTAIDVLSFEQLDGISGQMKSGISVLDLKARARYKDFSFKIKLDVDDGGLGTVRDYKLVEQATIAYRPNYDWEISAGKYKPAFHQLHYGFRKQSIIDGGTVIFPPKGTFFRDLDNRPVVSVRYGGYKKGWKNTFSIFNDETTFDKPEYDDKGNFTQNSYKKLSGKMDLSKQIGVSNRFEYYADNGLKLGAAALWYKYSGYSGKTVDDTFGLSASFDWRMPDLEIWGEYVYGQGGTPAGVYKGFYKSYEQTLQLGAEYMLDPKWSVGFDFGYVATHNKDWKDNSWKDKKGKKHWYTSDIPEDFSMEVKNFKLEFGVKYRLAENTQFSFGPLIQRVLTYNTERSWNKKYGNYEAAPKEGGKYHTTAYQIAGGVSLWF